MSYTASPKRHRWVDLSLRHKLARESLLTRLKTFFLENQPTAPVAVVGPYGSGKTELMYLGYRYVWKELARPAFYMNLESLLKLLPQELPPGSLYDEVWKIVQDQLLTLKQVLNGNATKPLYLPDLGEKEPLERYFEQLGVDNSKIADVANLDEATLFIDEMEQHYKELRERFRTSDLSPLRSFFEKVEQRTEKPKFYVVTGFALGSAYEALGGAEARRKNTVPIPLPDPQEFTTLTKDPRYTNLLWWASRGRPGWALIIKENWLAYFDEIKRLDDEIMRRFFQERMDVGLPLVDASRINELITSPISPALKTLLLELRPIAKEEILALQVEEVLDTVGHYAMVADSLTTVDELIEAFTTDLKNYSKKADFIYKPDWILLADYLRRILTATSDSGRIAFGGWKGESEPFTYGVITPLLLLLHDVIIEFEWDTEAGQETQNFLHHIISELRIGVGKPDVGQVVSRFSQSKQLFRAYYNEQKVSYVQPSFKLLEEIFPRLVAKPLLVLTDAAKRDIESQRTHLEGAVEGGKSFLEHAVQIGEFTVKFVFMPSRRSLPILQDSYLSTVQSSEYLPYTQLIAIVNLKSEDGVQLDPAKNSDVKVLEELRKVRVLNLEERQLADFVCSLWHNMTISNRDYGQGLLPSLEQMQTDPATQKNARRTMEHYAGLLSDRFSSIAGSIVTEFKAVTNTVFPFKAADFPVERIKDALKIEETRGAEQVAAAFDIFLDRNRAVDTLAALRDLEQLRQRAREPHGYKEFFERYTVLQKPPRPSAAMEPIVEFVKRHDSFAKLREYAKSLHFTRDPSSTWMNLTESLRGCPVEHMFAWSTESVVFLRGLYLRVYLENHKERLLSDAELLIKSVQDLKDRLSKLKGEIEELNRATGKDILSTQIIQNIITELDRAEKLLEGTKQLPPAVLYITYRFLSAAVSKVEEDRQRWAGVGGIEGWRTSLDKILRFDEYLDGLRQRIESLYQMNKEMKEAEIGKSDEIFAEKVQKPLKDAVDDVLSSLSTGYELGEKIPDLDIDRLEEVQKEVEKFIEQTEGKASNIDEALGLLAKINQKIESIYRVMSQ